MLKADKIQNEKFITFYSLFIFILLKLGKAFFIY